MPVESTANLKCASGAAPRALALTAIWYFIWRLYRAIFQRLEVKRWLAPIVIIVAACVCTVPAVVFGFVRGDPIHLIWAKHFSDQLIRGNLLPQWLMDMNSGLGSPTFYYYGPVSYYLTTLFFILLPFGKYGWIQVGSAGVLASVASGVTCFLWLKQNVSRTAACVAALIYTWLPYHLRIDYFERFAFAEYWAFVWMPLNLYFVSLLAKGSKKSIVGISVTYALLIMTHPPAALLFSALPLCYGISVAPRKMRQGITFTLVRGLLLGIGLSAVYLLPALRTQSYASLKEMVVAEGSYANNFLFVSSAGVGPTQHWFSQWLAMMTRMTVVSLAAFLLLCFAGNSRPRRSEYILWLIVGLFCFVMMHPLSVPLWKAAPLLEKIQFPWRFHIIASLATTALAARAINEIPAMSVDRWKALSLCVALVLLAFQALLTIRTARWAWLEQPVINERLLYLDYPEYRPRWVPPTVYTVQGVKELAVETPLVHITEGNGTVRIREWSARHIDFSSDSDVATHVRVRQFYYPTWSATLENGAGCEVKPDSNGLLELAVPAGHHQIRLRIVQRGWGLIGRWISLVSASILGIGSLLAFRRRHHLFRPAEHTGPVPNAASV